MDRGFLPGQARFAVHLTGAGPADQSLWIDVPEEVVPEVADRLDTWLLWILPHAFETQQDLVIDGCVDPELLVNASELMGIWARWRPDRRAIRVIAEPADSDGAGRPSPRLTGLFFTGGVDSFFTLYHHDAMAAAHPEWRQRPVDDLIYVWGFDIPLDNAAAYAAKMAKLERVAVETGKRLVPIVTNLRGTQVEQPWGPVMHGPALGGVGLVLGGRWKHVLLSASFCHEDTDPWGSTGITDPLYSTSHTRTRHYGGDHDRSEKLAFLADFPLALETMHVCWQERSEQNCGRCEKCLRTLIALDVLGVRERATSFPPGPLEIGRLPEVWQPKPHLVRFHEHLRRHAEKAGRSDVVAVIDRCLEMARSTASSAWKSATVD